jgi:hypothetical protein
MIETFEFVDNLCKSNSFRFDRLESWLRQNAKAAPANLEFASQYRINIDKHFAETEESARGGKRHSSVARTAPLIDTRYENEQKKRAAWLPVLLNKRLVFSVRELFD